MSIKNFFLRSMATAIIASGVLLAPVAQAQQAGTGTYTTVDPVQPSDTPGKIEVLEFFAYTCPHCKMIEPLVEKWAKTLPSNVVMHPVPVAFNASMADLQKLFYSLESLDRMDLHAEVFKAIHDEKKRIYDQKAITDWIVGKGVDRKKFEEVFNSFGVKTKVIRANELAKNYHIDGTPSITIGGKYVTSPSMTGSYEGTIVEAQKLLDMVNTK